MKVIKEQSSKTAWVGGISKMNYSDIKNKEKIEEAIDEAIKDLSKNLREFATVRMFETAELFQDGKVIVRAEIRVFESCLKNGIFFHGLSGEEKTTI